MKFNLDRGEEHYHIDSYQALEYISVNGKKYTHSLIITHNQILPWSPSDFEALTPENFNQLLEINQGFILFGSGKNHQFPSPDLLNSFYTNNTAIEIMSTNAACRTFNVLMSENRAVTAALLL